MKRTIYIFKNGKTSEKTVTAKDLKGIREKVAEMFPEITGWENLQSKSGTFTTGLTDGNAIDDIWVAYSNVSVNM